MYFKGMLWAPGKWHWCYRYMYYNGDCNGTLCTYLLHGTRKPNRFLHLFSFRWWWESIHIACIIIHSDNIWLSYEERQHRSIHTFWGAHKFYSCFCLLKNTWQGSCAGSGDAEVVFWQKNTCPVVLFFSGCVHVVNNLFIHLWWWKTITFAICMHVMFVHMLISNKTFVYLH